MIRSIFFDLGKVIVDFSHDIAYRRMQTLSGLARDEVHARFLADGLPADFETGRMDSAAFVAEVNRRMGTSLGMDEFAELWSSIFHREPLLPESLLQRLRDHHTLVLLSNTNPLHFGMIRENYPHIGYFHSLVLSHEVGSMKPDAAIYQAAIEASGHAADECLFFDDLADNVAGARREGLCAEQFTGVEPLLRDLERYGVRL